MSRRQCKFKEDPQFRNWLGEVSGDVQRAYCKFCNKSFDVGHLGTRVMHAHVKVTSQLKSERRIKPFMSVMPLKDLGEESSCPTNQEPQTTTVHKESGSYESTVLEVNSTSKRGKAQEHKAAWHLLTYSKPGCA